jgi:hypothetical protein
VVREGVRLVCVAWCVCGRRCARVRGVRVRPSCQVVNARGVTNEYGTVTYDGCAASTVFFRFFFPVSFYLFFSALRPLNRCFSFLLFPRFFFPGVYSVIPLLLSP